jgi:hypothetical protein
MVDMRDWGLEGRDKRRGRDISVVDISVAD